MAEKEVRKTTTKRTVRRTTAKTVSAKTTARQAGVTSVRKAPTRITVAESNRPRRSPKGLIIGIVVFSLLMGVSAAIGFTDKGQLDVENMITLRKENATGDEKISLEAVPTQQTQSSEPNGGLVGMGQIEELPPPPVIEPVTGTSTEASSTTQTEEGTTEDQETLNNDQTNAEQSAPTESTPAPETTPDTVAQ